MCKLCPHTHTKAQAKDVSMTLQLWTAPPSAPQCPLLFCICSFRQTSHIFTLGSKSDAQSARLTHLCKNNARKQDEMPLTPLPVCDTTVSSQKMQNSALYPSHREWMDLQHHKIINMANKTWLLNSVLLLMKSNTICTVFKSMQGGWEYSWRHYH